MLKRLLLLGLVLITFSGVVSAEDSVTQGMKQIESKQNELTLKEIQIYKSEIDNYKSTLENKVTAIDNRVTLKLGMLGLIVFALGAILGFLVTLKWRTKEVAKIIEKEAADFRGKIRKDVLEVFSSEDRDLQNGLDASIQRSIERTQHEQNSRVLVVTGETDNKLQEMLPSLGFDKDKFMSMSIEQVFNYQSGVTTPDDQGFDLVILDTLKQEDACKYIQAGEHKSYLLYKEGYYPEKVKDENGELTQPHPFLIPRDKIIFANSKPTVYGHIMTLLSFNKVGR